MWQRKALEAKFEGDDLHAFLELLRVVAYNMSNGPWRGFWVKYGYDPSQDSVARLYQALDVRWKEAGLEKLKTSYGEVWKRVKAEEGREGVEEEVELKLFGLPVRRQMVFQLCDLGSASLQRLVLGVPRKAECTAQGGWFRLSDLTVLRGKIKRYLSGKVAECVRTGTVDPVTGSKGEEGGREEGALSPVEMIFEAEARREEEVVLPERDSGGNKGGGGGGRVNGAAAGCRGEEGEEDDGVMTAAMRKSKRKATGGGRGGGMGGRVRGGRGRGGKRARRAVDDEEGTHEGESEEEEGESDRNGGEGEEEEYYGQGRGDEEGIEDDEEAGARQLESLLGHHGRRTVDRAGANAAAVARGRARHQEEDEEEENTLGGTFVIPLTAGDVQNASSIRLLGGYQGADYSSSSSDDDDGSD
eukprot:evm.model.NODE_32736_length_9362_cov_17.354305.1